MPFDMFLALAAFAMATAVTPGPNNIMVTASGVNFGFARTMPHILGITFGFFALIAGLCSGAWCDFCGLSAITDRAESCRRGVHALARLEGRDLGARIGRSR